jgi:mycothiol S-conjugate amidase
MSENLTILAIFAHPDDEIGVGSTLAKYSAAGVRIVLVCATRGEAATIFCEDCATRETLAEVRTQELQCACEHLGVKELRWLDWPDGQIKGLPHQQAVREIVKLIRDVRPFVILTHPENGLYPHPDHLAVFRIVREAFDLSVDPRLYEEAGLPWGAARLFTRAMPQSMFERAPGLTDFRVELNGELLPFMGTPDSQIDVTMRVEQWVPDRMAAWDCHRSQHNPKGFSSIMPDGLRQEMAANEHYLLTASRLPLPKGVHDDLLAGLWREAQPAPEMARVPPSPRVTEVAAPIQAMPQPAPAQPVPVEVPSPTEQIDDLTERFISHMEAELAVHLALTEVLKIYTADAHEAKAATMYRELAEGEQEAIYRLARTLRQAGGSPGKVKAQERLIHAARKRDTPEHRHVFLREEYGEIRNKLVARVNEAAVVEEREVWEELALLVRSQLETLAG